MYLGTPAGPAGRVISRRLIDLRRSAPGGSAYRLLCTAIPLLRPLPVCLLILLIPAAAALQSGRRSRAAAEFCTPYCSLDRITVNKYGHSGDTSNIAASRKHSKYDPLIARHHLKFQLIACAIETYGAFGTEFTKMIKTIAGTIDKASD
eukprot:COSAG01_NODE_2493_length_7581_cov_126.097167_4_plen_148_part_01